MDGGTAYRTPGWGRLESELGGSGDVTGANRQYAGVSRGQMAGTPGGRRRAPREAMAWEGREQSQRQEASGARELANLSGSSSTKQR